MPTETEAPLDTETPPAETLETPEAETPEPEPAPAPEPTIDDKLKERMDSPSVKYLAENPDLARELLSDKSRLDDLPPEAKAILGTVVSALRKAEDREKGAEAKGRAAAEEEWKKQDAEFRAKADRMAAQRRALAKAGTQNERIKSAIEDAEKRAVGDGTPVDPFTNPEEFEARVTARAEAAALKKMSGALEEIAKENEREENEARSKADEEARVRAIDAFMSENRQWFPENADEHVEVFDVEGKPSTVDDELRALLPDPRVRKATVDEVKKALDRVKVVHEYHLEKRNAQTATAEKMIGRKGARGASNQIPSYVDDPEGFMRWARENPDAVREYNRRNS